MKLGLPSEKHALALWLPGALLAFGNPYGVNSPRTAGRPTVRAR